MRETIIGLAACAALILVGIAVNRAGIGANNRQRVLEATVEMESLATKLDHAMKIAPETKLEIARIINQPWYNCNQMACPTVLETRNRAARAHLRTVLEGSGVPTELSARAMPHTNIGN
ncbi:MAG: hypothetical protein WA322_04500 [Pseudolabrys sp.]